MILTMDKLLMLYEGYLKMIQSDDGGEQMDEIMIYAMKTCPLPQYQYLMTCCYQ